MNKPFKFPLDNQKELFPELVEDKSVYMYGNFEDTLGHFTPKPPSDYEFDNFMSQPEEGLVSEVHSKIYKQNGSTKIVTVKRKFYGDNDYQDSYHSEIL